MFITFLLKYIYTALETLKLSSCPPLWAIKNNSSGSAFQTSVPWPLSFTTSFLQGFELLEVAGQKAAHLLGKPESNQGSINNQVLFSPWACWISCQTTEYPIFQRWIQAALENYSNKETFTKWRVKASIKTKLLLPLTIVNGTALLSRPSMQYRVGKGL